MPKHAKVRAAAVCLGCTAQARAFWTEDGNGGGALKQLGIETETNIRTQDIAAAGILVPAASIPDAINPFPLENRDKNIEVLNEIVQRKTVHRLQLMEELNIGDDEIRQILFDLELPGLITRPLASVPIYSSTRKGKDLLGKI